MIKSLRILPLILGLAACEQNQKKRETMDDTSASQAIEELEFAPPNLYYDILDRIYDPYSADSRLSEPQRVLRDVMVFYVTMGNGFETLLSSCGHGHQVLYRGDAALRAIGYEEMALITGRVINLIEELGVAPPSPMPDAPYDDSFPDWTEDSLQRFELAIKPLDKEFFVLYTKPLDYTFETRIRDYVLKNRAEFAGSD